MSESTVRDAINLVKGYQHALISKYDKDIINNAIVALEDLSRDEENSCFTDHLVRAGEQVAKDEKIDKLLDLAAIKSDRYSFTPNTFTCRMGEE